MKDCRKASSFKVTLPTSLAGKYMFTVLSFVKICNEMCRCVDTNGSDSVGCDVLIDTMIGVYIEKF